MMNGPNEVTVTVVGLVTVFIVFVILFFIIELMTFLGSGRNKKVKTPTSPQGGQPSIKAQGLIITEETTPQKSVEHIVRDSTVSTGDEEIAAVFAAVYTVMGEDVTIKSIYRKENVRSTKGHREWVEWRNHGWRGGNRW
ncbi:MAG TPA: OadG family transporter subunit [Fervidobacterium sp.]|nr:oxaloacetate decarboxylase, gamma chain [Fervidobacterium sp.]HQE48169.1 OadG family transporter subunit [Fervidobacterium sp.]HUM41892.1 OadG family transporter subunit [Fervidobacterium sp.]